MRAVQAKTYGGPEVLEVVDLPVPTAVDGEVLVRVAAAGTNPVDAKSREGHLSAIFGDEGPFVWGWDISGTVEAVADGVTRFAVGDEVFGMPRFPDLASAYAEYVTAPAVQLAYKPATIDQVEAGALPLAALTAQQALDSAGLKPGQRVLVNAAAGGVGHLAVQLAKAVGAHVIGVARADNAEFLRGIGADEVIDYRAADVAATVRDIDVLVDGMEDPRLLETIRPGGAAAPLPQGLTAEYAAAARARGIRPVHVFATPDGPGLGRIAALVETGRLKVHVSEVLDLADAAKAHELLATGRTRGKIVLTP